MLNADGIQRLLNAYYQIGTVRQRHNAFAPYIGHLQLPILSYICEDKQLQMADVKGESILDLPDSSNLVNGVQAALDAIGI